MPFVEYVNIPQATADVYGNRRIARMFRVWGVDQRTLQMRPEMVENSTGEKLPALGSYLPTDWQEVNAGTGQARDPDNAYQVQSLLEFYTIVRTNGVVFDVVANYTTMILDRRYLNTFQYGLSDVPFQYLIAPSTTQQGQGGFLRQWADDVFRFPTVMTRWSIELSVSKAEYISKASDIAAQVNNVHRIRFGQLDTDPLLWVRFESPEAIHQGPVYNRVRYSWIQDPGLQSFPEGLAAQTDNRVNSAGNGQLYCDINKPFQDKDSAFDTGYWVRPPYTVLKAVAQIPTDNTAAARAENPIPKRFVAWPLYNKIEEEGWKKLPGLERRV